MTQPNVDATRGSSAVVRRGAATGTVPASPGVIFEAITDIGRLPEWNKVIRCVVERPDALSEGAEWVVTLKPPGMPEWSSRSKTLEHDPVHHRFRYRTSTEDGNPSWAIWEWQVERDGDGSKVTVTWELHPKTLARRVLFSRIRHRALRREVHESIAALGALVARS